MTTQPSRYPLALRLLALPLRLADAVRCCPPPCLALALAAPWVAAAGWARDVACAVEQEVAEWVRERRAAGEASAAALEARP